MHDMTGELKFKKTNFTSGKKGFIHGWTVQPGKQNQRDKVEAESRRTNKAKHMGTLKLDGDCVILQSPTQKIPKVTISQSAYFVLTDQQEGTDQLNTGTCRE